ncbi:MAG: porin [Planctomycetes bacterium]|nr:porin [Planctomycetota bacterium]
MRKLLAAVVGTGLLLLPARGLVAEGGDIEISGLVDVGFTHNFNDPSRAQNAGTGNVVRGFHNREDTFALNLAQLSVSKAAEPVGFNLKLDFFQTVRGGTGIDFSGVGTTPGDDIAVQQAYIAYNTGIGSGLNLKAGKFVTLLVRDVIEANANWFQSYGYEFFLVPFTHLGLRMSYPFLDNLTGTIGVNNGADTDVDDNHGKQIEGQISFSPTEAWTLNLSFNYGAEAANNEGDKLFFLSFVTTYNCTENCSTFLSFLYGNAEDVLANPVRDADIYSIAVGAQYKFTDRYGVSGRFEYLSDETRTFNGARNLWGFTLTGNIWLTEDLEFRLEYRHDEATGRNSQNVFNDGVSDTGVAQTDDAENTFGVQLLYTF